MIRGEFIREILRRYVAFYDENIVKTDAGTYAVHFVWKWDTAFAHKPLFSCDSILYDYSPILNMEVNRENYKRVLRDPCAGCQGKPITNLKKADAEQIMLNNMLALERVNKLHDKAEKIKSIMED